MAHVELKGVTKTFGNTEVIRDVELEINKGEFVVFVGPSGCGKSTLLRLISGLEKLSSGEIIIANKEVMDLPPSERGIAMVFQSYALYPHMSVYQNMAFSLDLQKMPKLEIKQRVEEAAKIFLAKGVKNIVITLGPKGLYFANSDESFFIDVYSLKDKVIDTTGAGDAFNGAFAYALSNNLKIKDALEFSNKVAAISTTKAGAANSMPSINEVKTY